MFSNYDFSTFYGDEGPSTSTSNNMNRLSLDSGIGLGNETSFEDNAHDDMNQSSSFVSSCCSTSAATADSPPTKWARIATPPKSDVIMDERGNLLTTFEAVNRTMAMFSPPTRNRRSPFASPTPSYTLRTPTSAISVRLSTPSPFRVTISKTPLKLSNNENVSGYHIGRRDDIKTIGRNQHVVRCIGISNPKRCLIPDETMTPEKNSIFEGFEELAVMTPSKLNEALFEGCVPQRDLNYPSTSYAQNDPMYNPLALPLPPSTTNSHQIETQIQDHPGSYAIITQQPIRPHNNTKKVVTIMTPEEQENLENHFEKRKKKLDIEKWSNEPFVTPEKELKVNTGQWVVISTGKTRAQRELFEDATNFLKKRKSRTRVPTISRLTLFKHRYGSLATKNRANKKN